MVSCWSGQTREFQRQARGVGTCDSLLSLHVLWEQEERSVARPKIDLELIGIPVGATLTLRGRDDVNCVVIGLSPPEIVYEGKVVSLSKAAERA